MNRSELCDELRAHWETVCLAAAVQMINELYSLDPEEVCDKILGAQSTYGDMDLFGSDWHKELREEVVDCVAYSLFLIYSGADV